MSKESILVGVLDDNQTELLGRILDEQVNFNNIYKGRKLVIKLALKFIESKDNDIITGALAYIDDHYADRLPDKYKSTIRAMLVAIIEKDKDSFVINSGDLLNMLIDIPKVSEDKEAVIITGILNGIVEALKIDYFA